MDRSEVVCETVMMMMMMVVVGGKPKKSFEDDGFMSSLFEQCQGR